MKKGAQSQGRDEAFEDLLSQMFGVGVGGSMPGMPGMPGMGGMGQGRSSADAVQQFEVSLEDLYKGKQVKMMSKRKIICSSCKGYVVHVHWLIKGPEENTTRSLNSVRHVVALARKLQSTCLIDPQELSVAIATGQEAICIPKTAAKSAREQRLSRKRRC